MEPVRFQGENSSVYYEFDKNSTPLGEGGMGRIFVGYRIDTAYNIKSIVAIKCIRQELIGKTAVIQRAQREASVQLNDSRLIRMYGFFSGAEYNMYSNSYIPSYYIVMELLSGVNLDAALFSHKVSNNLGNEIELARDLLASYSKERENTAVKIFKEILLGVAALHQNGYIHRDLDLSNVMLTEEGYVKIIDFGISKRMSSIVTDGGLTQAGQFLGKIAFSAPELILGDIKSQGPHTDIYALGVMLFQLLKGYLPVEGSDQEVMSAHLAGKLNYKDIENPGLRAIIKKATEVEIANRYRSVEEMYNDLESIEYGKIGNAVKRERKEFSIPSWIAYASAPAGLVLGILIKLLTIL